MGYLVTEWGHVAQGRGAIARNQNIDVCTKLQFPRSVVSGCTVRLGNEEIPSAETTAHGGNWCKFDWSLRAESETGARFGRAAKGHLLP